MAKKVLYIKDESGTWRVADIDYIRPESHEEAEIENKILNEIYGRDNWKITSYSARRYPPPEIEPRTRYYIDGREVNYKEYLAAETEARLRKLEEARTPPTSLDTISGLPRYEEEQKKLEIAESLGVSPESIIYTGETDYRAVAERLQAEGDYAAAVRTQELERYGLDYDYMEARKEEIKRELEGGPIFSGLPVSQGIGLKEIRTESGAIVGYEDTILKASYPKEVLPYAEPLRREILDAQLKDLVKITDPVEQKQWAALLGIEPFEIAVEKQRERERKFYYNLSPFYEAIDYYSSKFTFGKQRPVEERGIIGRLSEKAISGIGKSAITLPGLPAMAFEKSYLAVRGLALYPGSTAKELYITAPIKTAKQTYDIRTDEGKLTYIFAGIGAIGPSIGALKQIKVTVKIRQPRTFKGSGLSKSAGKSPRGKLAANIEQTSPVKILRDVKIEEQYTAFGKILKSKVITEKGTIISFPERTVTIIPRKAAAPRGIVKRLSRDARVQSQYKAPTVLVSKEALKIEKITPELVRRTKELEIIPEKGVAKHSKLQVVEQFKGKKTIERTIDTSKAHIKITGELELTQATKTRATATPRITKYETTVYDPIYSVKRVGKLTIERGDLVSFKKLAEPLSGVKRPGISGEYALKSVNEGGILGYQRITKVPITQATRTGKFKATQTKGVKFEPTKFTFSKKFKAEPKILEVIKEGRVKHELETFPPELRQQSASLSLLKTKKPLEIVVSRKKPAGYKFVKSNLRQNMFKSKKAQRSQSQLSYILNKLKKEPKVRVKTGKPIEANIGISKVLEELAPKQKTPLAAILGGVKIKSISEQKPITEIKAIPKSKPIVKPKSESKLIPESRVIAEPKSISITSPIQEALSKSIQEPILSPKEKALSKAIQEPIQEPISESITKPIQEPIQEAITTPIQEPITEPIQEPTEIIIDIPEPPSNLLFAGAERKGREPQGKKVEGFNVYMLEGGKRVKANLKPLPKKEAHRLGRDIADNSLSASFHVTKTDIKVPAARRSKLATGLNPSPAKFRASKKNSNYIVEKRKFRLDSPGEKRGITAARLIAERKKGIVANILGPPKRQGKPKRGREKRGNSLFSIKKPRRLIL